MEKYHVQYLLIGGYAVQFHGIERQTSDLDVWVGDDRENIDHLKLAAAEFGYQELDKIEQLYTDPELILPVGRPDSPIELMTHLSGVDYAACYPRRAKTQINSVPVSIISKADLVAYKRAYGRPKDLADAERLEQ